MLRGRRTATGNTVSIRWKEDLPQALELVSYTTVRLPTVTSDTLAAIGKFASMVNIKGVIPVDKTNEEIENALSPRIVFLNGAS